MIDYKKNLTNAVVAKVAEHFSVPYPKIEEVAKEKEVSPDLDLFFFGNIQKGKSSKAEMEDLKKYQPALVVDFILHNKAYSASGVDISEGFNSIYFTIKKDVKDDK